MANIIFIDSREDKSPEMEALRRAIRRELRKLEAERKSATLY